MTATLRLPTAPKRIVNETLPVSRFFEGSHAPHRRSQRGTRSIVPRRPRRGARIDPKVRAARCQRTTGDHHRLLPCL